MAGIFLITGATGFVGGHVAEALAKRGEKIRALARASSDTSLLKSLGTEIIPGDMTDADALKLAADGVSVVVHCAAKVGDWGPIEGYRAANVDGLRSLLTACRGQNLQRFVHVSSLGVYEARHHYQTDESVPLPQTHVDGYTQSKVEAEKVALEFIEKDKLPIVILRPGFIYGPRDRTVLPTIVKNLQRRVVRYISGGKYALNTTYVSNLVDAIVLAIDRPGIEGQVFNITDGEFISKRKFFETIADFLGLKRPGLGGPLWSARILTRYVEKRARKKGWTEAPRLTMARLKFLGMNLDFSIAKARTKLGYNPQIGFDAGMRTTLEWFKANVPLESLA